MHDLALARRVEQQARVTAEGIHTVFKLQSLSFGRVFLWDGIQPRLALGARLSRQIDHSLINV